MNDGMGQTLKRVLITLGDPGGVGPEVVLKALSQYTSQTFMPVLVSSSIVMAHPVISTLLNRLTLRYEFIDVNPLFPAKFVTMADDAVNGTVSVKSIERAVSAIQSGKGAALVTAPISKTSLQLAGYKDTGHTTLLKRLSGAPNVSMAFYTPKLKTILTTIHVALKDVPDLITFERLETTVLHGIMFCESLGIKAPKIAIAGLNPHAGEGGLFGKEEINVISPFVTQFSHPNAKLTGPYPPDTLFYRAIKGDFDLVVSLYHDQGLIPVKALAFDEAVNVSIGLPFVRTSPDHGTAFDIAYTDSANPTSMKAAIDLAIEMTV